MNNRFEISADANARLAMLDRLNKTRQTRDEATPRPSGNQRAKQVIREISRLTIEQTANGFFTLRPEFVVAT